MPSALSHKAHWLEANERGYWINSAFCAWTAYYMIYMHMLTCGQVHICIWICVYTLQVLACFVQVIPANSLHSTSSRGKSIAEGIIDLLSDNHWLTGTEVKVQCVRARLQETAALCRTPDTVRTPYINQLIRIYTFIPRCHGNGHGIFRTYARFLD